MLLEFSVANFRSIKDRQTLSLLASNASELRSTHVYDPGEKLPPVVRSAVVYGANAAGKSNLLLAIQFAQAIVLGSASQSQAGQRIGVVPFAFQQGGIEKPTEFEFMFAEAGVRYHYGFALTQERVVREWLVAYPKGKPQRWFEREFDADKGNYSWTLGTNFRGDKSQRNTWRELTRENALFLSTAVQLNNEQLHPVFGWFQNKLGIVTMQNNMNVALSLELLNDPQKRDQLNQFIRAADVGIESLELRQEQPLPGTIININIGGPQILPGAVPSAQLPKFGRVIAHHKHTDSDLVAQLDLFADESEGTRKIFQYAGGWIKALQDGVTLLVDELDRSLHPLMTRFLVELFHDPKRNAQGAQLVFTTHDTTLLDTSLFRRDQIWFVEKDKESATRLYPLLEYSPRKDEALERGYLKGRYGAIPFLSPVDFNG
jgi:AAA15 family ATPase/GTPase